MPSPRSRSRRMFWQPDCDPLSVEMGIYSLLEAERFDRCFLLQFTYVSETVPCHVTQEAVGSSPVPPTTSYPNLRCICESRRAKPLSIFSQEPSSMFSASSLPGKTP